MIGSLETHVNPILRKCHVNQATCPTLCCMFVTQRCCKVHSCSSSARHTEPVVKEGATLTPFRRATHRSLLITHSNCYRYHRPGGDTVACSASLRTTNTQTHSGTNTTSSPPLGSRLLPTSHACSLDRLSAARPRISATSQDEATLLASCGRPPEGRREQPAALLL